MRTRRRHFMTSTLAGLLAGRFVGFVRGGLGQGTLRAGRTFVVFYYPHSMRRQGFPTGTENDFRLSEALSPLEPLREHCVFFGPMTMRSGTVPRGYDNHAGMMHCLTAHAQLDGGALGPSADQVIADRIGASTPRKSLNLWTWVDPVGFGQPSISTRGFKQKVSNEASPHTAYKSLMLGNGAMPSAEFDALMKGRRSVLDKVVAELTAIRGPLAGEERRMMDAHIESVRAVEKALFSAGKVGGACKADAEALGPELDIRSPANFATLVKLHTDVMVTALACDITRVGIIQAGNEHNETVTFPWVGVNKTHHLGIQHNGSSTEWTAVTKWFVEQFAYLLKSMKAIPTPTGNLLSDSVVLMLNNMGSGHSIYDLLYVLGGNAGGRIRGNRLIPTSTGSTDQKTKQLAHAQLLLSICHAMGLDDLEHFGRPGPEFCPGPVPGLVAP